MKRIKKIVIYAVIVIAVIAGIIAVRKFTSGQKNIPTAVSVSKTVVEAQEVKLVEKNSGDTYKATLEACEQGIVNSKLSARVTNISFENGQYINAGDTLITLDDQDIRNNIKSSESQLKVTEQQLSSAEVSLKKLKLNLDDAQRNYDRQKALYEKEAISQVDFQATEKALNSAQADYEAGNVSIQTAKVNIEAQKVSLSNLQDNLNNTVIKAPISGVISGKSVNIGQMVSQGTALATVNNISSVYAKIQVPEDKITSVKVRQAATVKVDGSDSTYNGIVQNIDLSADTSARVFNCKIKIDNSDKTLYPGVFAKVDLISDEKTEMITVPINALVGSEGNYSVFINDNGKAKKQKVTIGETDENNVEIISGAQNGDQVICSNTGSLQDGDEIDVVVSENNNSTEETSKQNGDSTEAVSE